MSEKKERRVEVNPLGPHFEIQGNGRGDVPAAVRDVSMGTVPTRLEKRFEDHGWDVTIEHVEPGVEMATVWWDSDAENPEDTLEFEIDELSMEWYNRTPYDYDDYL